MIKVSKQIHAEKFVVRHGVRTIYRSMFDSIFVHESIFSQKDDR